MSTFMKEMLPKIKINPLLDTLRLENIDDKIYFSKEYADYISNSRLSLINPLQDGSPKKYFEGLTKHSGASTSFAFGSAVHELTLQPESFFLVEDVNAPTAKVGLIADLAWGSAKNDGLLPLDGVLMDAAAKADYYKGNLSSSQMTKLKESLRTYYRERFKFEKDSTDTREPIYFDEKSRDRLKEVLKSLNKNVEIQKLLHPEDITGNPLTSENERTILLDIEVTVPGVDPFVMSLKAKLDNFTIDTLNNVITVNDVKTTGKVCSEFTNAIQTFHYYREIAFYSWLLKLCADKFYNMKNPKIKGNFLVVETIPSYWSAVTPMEQEWFAAGIKEAITLIKMIAYYKTYGYDDKQ